MPAAPRGHLKGLGGASFTSLLILQEINDVAAGRYDFFNHCILAAWINVMADKFRHNVQRTAQILREKLWQRRLRSPDAAQRAALRGVVRC
jgi:hypothetical protein